MISVGLVVSILRLTSSREKSLTVCSHTTRRRGIGLIVYVVVVVVVIFEYYWEGEVSFGLVLLWFHTYFVRPSITSRYVMLLDAIWICLHAAYRFPADTDADVVVKFSITRWEITTGIIAFRCSTNQFGANASIAVIISIDSNRIEWNEWTNSARYYYILLLLSSYYYMSLSVHIIFPKWNCHLLLYYSITFPKSTLKFKTSLSNSRVYVFFT